MIERQRYGGPGQLCSTAPDAGTCPRPRSSVEPCRRGRRPTDSGAMLSEWHLRRDRRRLGGFASPASHHLGGPPRVCQTVACRKAEGLDVMAIFDGTPGDDEIFGDGRKRYDERQGRQRPAVRRTRRRPRTRRAGRRQGVRQPRRRSPDRRRWQRRPVRRRERARSAQRRRRHTGRGRRRRSPVRRGRP